MISQTGHSENEIRECARDICFILNNVENKSFYKAIQTKYNDPKYLSVSALCKRLSESNKNWIPYDKNDKNYGNLQIATFWSLVVIN